MKKNPSTIIIGFLLVLAIFLKLCVYQVSDRECAVVTLFGKVQHEINAEAKSESNILQHKSGIFFKFPFFFQKIIRFNRVIRTVKTATNQYPTSDNSSLLFTLTAGWKVISPHKFYESISDIAEMDQMIIKNIRGALGRIIPSYKLSELISTDSNNQFLFDQFESQMKENVQKNLKNNGVAIVFLKVTHFAFPQENIKNILESMKAEWLKEANAVKAKGEAQAKKIRESAEIEKKIALSEAIAEAKKIKAEAEEKAATYYKVFEKEPDLAHFLLKMDAFTKILENNETPIYLDKDTVPFTLLDINSINQLKAKKYGK